MCLTRRATFGSCVDCEALSDILRPTPLVRPYRKGAWFAEPLSMVVRTSLSGFLLICLPTARRMRLVISFGIALLYALIVATGEPFQSRRCGVFAESLSNLLGINLCKVGGRGCCINIP